MADSSSSSLPSEMAVYNTQQAVIKNIITKNKAVITGTGYAGSAPNYTDLTVDNTDVANLAFTSPNIYYPGVNVGYKEVHDSVSSMNRFSKSIGYSRKDYYALEDSELTVLGNLMSYHQQVLEKLVQVPK